MREICLSGSEGGGIEPNRSSLPLSKKPGPFLVPTDPGMSYPWNRVYWDQTGA
jgi:hypothetical protein